MMTTIVTQHDMQAALRSLGVAGSPVCVHASLRSFGYAAGGARALSDTFLHAGCTLLVPSFSWSFAVSPPPAQHVAQNGWQYATSPGPTSGMGGSTHQKRPRK